MFSSLTKDGHVFMPQSFSAGLGIFKSSSRASFRLASRRALFALGIASVQLVGCTESRSEAPTAPHASRDVLGPIQFQAVIKAAAAQQVAAAVAGRTDRGFEDDILRAEAKAPTLGGIFLDSAGVLTAYVVDSTKDELARSALQTLLVQTGTMVGHALGGARRIQIRRGLFAFSELVAGQQALAVRPNVKLVTLDANEAINQISVGVLDSAGLKQVFADSRSLGIPDAAISVSIMSNAPTIATDLAGRFRPTIGGVVLSANAPSPPTSATCSLGWNVTRVDSGAVQFYITAAHCLKAILGEDVGPGSGISGGISYQPGNLTSDELGSLSYVSEWNESGCDGAHGTLCTSSDVMQIRYYAGITGTKAVAKTQVVGTSSAGSTDQVGLFTSNGLTAAVAGQSVDKVGYHSGWTRGSVVQTCETVYFNLGTQPIDGQSWEGHKCLIRTTGSVVVLGDSGSPLFTTPAPTAPTLVGTLGIVIGHQPSSGGDPFCSSPCIAWSTGWAQIEPNLHMTTSGGLVPY